MKLKKLKKDDYFVLNLRHNVVIYRKGEYSHMVKQYYIYSLADNVALLANGNENVIRIKLEI